MDFKTGGREVIERLIEAYGFTTRQALCDHLGVSKSTLATRYMRDIFPAEWVIQCAIETGAALRWLASGEGSMFDNKSSDIVDIPRKKLIDGVLYESNHYSFDKALLPRSLQVPLIIIHEETIYITEKKFEKFTDGNWFIKLNDLVSLRSIIKIPNEKLKIDNGKINFECKISDIELISKVTSRIEKE
ncbi:TPA: phage repressor protein CI [Serratia marcescens]|uniref:phage repressor protein CI n=1 Tax=Serratia marcescens TaxID=615 RepID=UPI0018D2EAF7|nr:phage repressor protein CI [Serratia marcescens]MBH1895240.1 phage repressor protein CI [Serratia marcescens]MBH2690673.1 phage repressor protein CI [Serratia marcescens]MBH2740586.1 phage repressor protein CI [Serratia marcescens]MBH2828766.1 phage repressor protein CI [Serratia marcescens]MBH3222004.1 phage repressor protein CI [Serratia marcescens]